MYLIQTVFFLPHDGWNLTKWKVEPNIKQEDIHEFWFHTMNAQFETNAQLWKESHWKKIILNKAGTTVKGLTLKTWTDQKQFFSSLKFLLQINCLGGSQA